MNLVTLSERINRAVVQYNESFLAKHAEPDFGECGNAVVLIGFGRKRKLKNAFEEALLVGSSWQYCGKKMFIFEYDGNAGIPVPTQYAGYYRERAYIVANVLEEWLDVMGYVGVDVTVHSWID